MGFPRHCGMEPTWIATRLSNFPFFKKNKKMHKTAVLGLLQISDLFNRFFLSLLPHPLDRVSLYIPEWPPVGCIAQARLRLLAIYFPHLFLPNSRFIGLSHHAHLNRHLLLLNMVGKWDFIGKICFAERQRSLKKQAWHLWGSCHRGGFCHRT